GAAPAMLFRTSVLIRGLRLDSVRVYSLPKPCNLLTEIDASDYDHRIHRISLVLLSLGVFGMSIVERRGHLLDREGIRTDRVKWNLSAAALYEEAIRKQEGVRAAEGPLVCRTGSHTGRSPNDKFTVR